MNKQLVLVTALSMLATTGFSQKKATPAKKAATTATKEMKTADGFVVLPSGLEFQFIKNVPGTTPQIGDQIEMHFKSRVNDSVLFNTRNMQKDPVLFPLQKPSFHGDVNEGLAMMSAGDVAVFRTPLDSIVKAGQMLLPWMKSSDKMVYDIEVISVKTQAEVQKENEAKATAQINTDEQILKEYFTANKIAPKKTASGLYYSIWKDGKGENAKAGQKVTVNYTGKTTNGEVFDSNIDSAFHHVEPFAFDLGKGNVIKGWDEGITLLNKGAKATLYIPSRYAYGPQSPSPKIPANSVLIFDVEVVDISGEAGAAPSAAPHNHDHGDNHDGHKH
ncbi:MAG TPA: FKBP-type peptidyl-prolyl cis-trans isomerase [Flavipsychrobacter sp.]|nr:FKBP-type peptidyl-prolyl cis-trans isomerase [Flavipsychrobacter sp.]